MADDQSGRPVVPGEHFCAEGVSSGTDAFGTLGRVGPPGLRKVIKIMLGPSCRKAGPRAAYIAGEVVAFANTRMDENGEAERSSKGCRGLQGPCVGRGQDSADPDMAQAVHSCFGLDLPVRGQMGIRNAWIPLGCREVQVELALAVAHQDHVPPAMLGKAPRQGVALTLP